MDQDGVEGGRKKEGWVANDFMGQNETAPGEKAWGEDEKPQSHGDAKDLEGQERDVGSADGGGDMKRRLRIVQGRTGGKSSMKPAGQSNEVQPEECNPEV